MAESGDSGGIWAAALVIGLLAASGVYANQPRERDDDRAGDRATATAAAGATRAANSPQQRLARQVCGAGYDVVVDSYRPGAGLQTVLAYSQAAGRNCAFTRREGSTAAELFVWVRHSDGAAKESHDEGRYRSWAGPVYLTAKGRCVDFGGGDSSRAEWGTRNSVGCH